VTTSLAELGYECRVTTSLCQTIGSPRALAVSLLSEAGEWQQLLDLEPHFGVATPQQFADDYLVSELLKKSPNLPLGVDKAQVALDAFRASEELCSKTNDRLLEPGLKPAWFYRARAIIRTILGPLTKGVLEQVVEKARHGPGAAVGVMGRGSVSSDKFDSECTLTSDLVQFARSIMGERWADHASKRIVSGARVATVPKNAKTDRTICIEPLLNMFLQLGIGAVMTARLKRFGVDLRDQGLNASLAQRAFRDWLATLDLSSASDLISEVLVEQLLPERWFHLLDLVRSKWVEMPDGEWVRIKKFSSMGNGFTFPLESLIFAAVAFALVPTADWLDVGIYGDDIIVPQVSAPAVVHGLEYLGFRTNLKKSHLAGDFFESCGSDWYRGVPVRPFYLRGRRGSDTPYEVRTANAIRAYARRDGLGVFCSRRFLESYHASLAGLPAAWKSCVVPVHLGDVGLWGSKAEATTSLSKHQEEGLYVKALPSKAVKLRKGTFGVLLTGLARAGGMEPEFTTGYESRRGLWAHVNRPRWLLARSWEPGWDWEI
jgi:hypothetical protein